MQYISLIWSTLFNERGGKCIGDIKVKPERKKSKLMKKVKYICEVGSVIKVESNIWGTQRRKYGEIK